MKKAVAIRHVPFEDLGNLAPELEKRGYEIQYLEAGVDSLKAINPLQPDLLISLGGPISVNDGTLFPWIAEEQEILRVRMEKDLPTLGFCLGAQFMAKAIGGKVACAPRKEIGWGPITLTPEGEKSPLAVLKGAVCHWHGENFTLPAGVKPLAYTEVCPNQAFQYGKNCLALQFHPEVTAIGLERWFIGHIGEISQTTGIDVLQLRRDTALHASRAQEEAALFWSKWFY